MLHSAPVAAGVNPVAGGTCNRWGIFCSGSDTKDDLISYITTVVNLFLALIAVAAAVFLIIGGVRYITSSGDEDQAEKAKKTVLYAILGLILVGLSAVIVNFVVVDAIGAASP